MGGDWSVAVRQEGLLWKTVTGGGQATMGAMGSLLQSGVSMYWKNIPILRLMFYCLYGCTDTESQKDFT